MIACVFVFVVGVLLSLCGVWLVLLCVGVGLRVCWRLHCCVVFPVCGLCVVMFGLCLCVFG